MKGPERVLQRLGLVGIRRKIFAAYIAVLVLAMILCSLMVGGYVNRFLRQRTKEYSLRGMSGIVYELDSLYQRLEQFTSTVYDRDFCCVINESTRAYTYQSLTRQLEFDACIQRNLLLCGLKADTVGMLVYIDDDRYYYVGDGVFRQNMEISQTDWYRRFADGDGESMFIGPLIEDYRPYSSTAQEVVLYLRRLNVPSASLAAAEYTPFVMMAVRHSSIEQRFGVYFGGERALISGLNGEVVYAAGIQPQQAEEIGMLLRSGSFQPEGEGLSSYSDRDMLVTNVYAPLFGWNISEVNPAKEIYADEAQVVGIINLMFAICGLLGVMLAWYLSRRVMIPIQTLNTMINRMEQSEDAFIDITGSDEVGQIGRRFNAMKRRLHELTSRAYIAEVREKQAQLHALQAQINPHFLYNTLDNIYCIARVERVERIAGLIQSLSAMMRYSIDSHDAQTVLDQELAHVRQYVEVLNLRFDGCIDYSEQVEVGLLDIPMLKLILQPVVENSWIHGISKKQSRRGKVILSAEVGGDCLRIVVEDDGVGMDERMAESLNVSLAGISPILRDTGNGAGIGLRNVSDRIKLQCGLQYGISVESAAGKGCRVTLTVRS